MPSDPAIAHANAFVRRFVIVFTVLTALNTVVASLFRTSPLAPLLSFGLTLAAAWLVAHLLFDAVDDLISARLAEIES